MIGRAETIVELYGIGLGLFFLAVGVTYWRMPAQRTKGIGMTLFACIFILIECLSFGTAWRHRQTLRALEPANVSAIQIGERTLREPAQIGRIVAALDAVVPFSPNHEADTDIPLVLTLADGGTIELRIKYRKATYEQGVVLHFLNDGDGGGWEQGYAFSAPLLPVLQELGVPLEP